MDLSTVILLFDSSIRLATPLLLACLAGLFSERAGIIDIGLEGKILISAFFSASAAAYTGRCLARPSGWDRGVDGLCRPARAGVDHLPGQPVDFRGGPQLPRRRDDRGDRRKLVRAWRAHAAA